MHARAHLCGHACTECGLLVRPILSARMQAAARFHGAGRACFSEVDGLGPRLAVPALSGHPPPHPARGRSLHPAGRVQQRAARRRPGGRRVRPARARAAGARRARGAPAAARVSSSRPGDRQRAHRPGLPGAPALLPYPIPGQGMLGPVRKPACRCGQARGAGSAGRPVGACAAQAQRAAASAHRRASGQQRPAHLPLGACGWVFFRYVACTAPGTCRPDRVHARRAGAAARGCSALHGPHRHASAHLRAAAAARGCGAHDPGCAAAAARLRGASVPTLPFTHTLPYLPYASLRVAFQPALCHAWIPAATSTEILTSLIQCKQLAHGRQRAHTPGRQGALLPEGLRVDAGLQQGISDCALTASRC
jgi:hypothetical protein